jgi:hypothetical protein
LYQQQQQQQPFTTPSRAPFSPAAMRTGGSSPAPLPAHMRTSPPQHQHPQQHQHLQQQQQQQHASAAGSMRSPSPFLPDAREGQSRRSIPTMQPQQLQQLQQAHQQQQQRPSLPNASVMAAPAPLCIIPADFAAGAQAPEEDMAAAASSVAAPSLDVDEFEGADDGSLNSEDDEEDDSDSRAGGEDEEGADDCIICAEQRADACLVQCGHMYTCTSCAAKLSRCPICRCAVERVVKVFAQQM